MGRVHFGKSVLLDGLEEASGTYLPGPTEFGVEVMFFSAPPAPLLNPKVYLDELGISGLSLG